MSPAVLPTQATADAPKKTDTLVPKPADPSPEAAGVTHFTADPEELERELLKAKARYAKIDGLVVTSEPCHAILVMGTHGRQGVSRVLLGSVAEKIVRLSPIPVLTVSGKSDEEAKTKALASD